MDRSPELLPKFSRTVERCALCGSLDLREVAKAGPDNTRIAVCHDCGLFISTPTLPFEKLQIFYCEEFEGDAGGAAARRAGKVHKSQERQLAKARQREMPIVRSLLGDLHGKSILDLRSRSGALAAAMQADGATVFASDPMLPNVELCERAGLKAFQIGVFEHSDLSAFGPSSFDAVTGLTIHVLAHLPEPDAFLRRAFELLKPGGYLMLDEKDVLRPARNLAPGVFATGIGHFYHFTPLTLAALLSAAGFADVEVTAHPGRTTSFRHLLAVARKPLDGQPVKTQPFRQRPEDVSSALARANSSASLRAPYNRFMRKARRWVKSLKH